MEGDRENEVLGWIGYPGVQALPGYYSNVVLLLVQGILQQALPRKA